MNRFMSHLDDLAGLDMHLALGRRPGGRSEPVVGCTPASGRRLVRAVRERLGFGPRAGGRVDGGWERCRGGSTAVLPVQPSKAAHVPRVSASP